MLGRILVVDDSQLVRVRLAQDLVAAGYEVDEAESGAHALDVLGRGNYDLVITSLQVPEMDGLEVLAAAKERGIEVIILAGGCGDDMGIAIRALRLGADDILAKPPPSADIVVLTVARAMEKRKLRESNRLLLQQVETLSHRDALTAIPNREAFDQAFDQEIARARRYDQPLGVLALDIDHFKRVNDTCGREGGHEVLRCFAQTVTRVLRKGDSLYRWGGDTFAVLLPFAEYAGVLAVGERIVKAVARSPVAIGTLTVPITTSAGAACLETSDNDRDLISRARRALHQAKAGGRNRVCLQNARPELTPSDDAARAGLEQE